MNYIKTRLAPVINRHGRIVALTTAAVLVPMASAQETGTVGVAQLNFAAWIQALQSSAVSVINQSGPALFGLMALIGGVYFVWNRVRSLW